MIYIFIFYLSGIILAKSVPMEHFLLISVCFILSLLLVFGLKKIKIYALFLILILGYFYCYSAINTWYIGKEAVFTAEIKDPSKAAFGYMTYDATLTKIFYENNEYNIKREVNLSLPEDTLYDYGDLVVFEGKIKYKYNSLYITPKRFLKLTEKKNQNPISYIRKSFFNKINSNFSKQNSAILNALLLGDRRNFSDEMTNLFVRSGLIHAVAVSGLHVVILISIATCFYDRLRFLGKRFNLKPYFLILIIIFFTLMTGANPPVLRAAIMGIIYIFASIFKKKYDPFSSLATAGVLLLLYSPSTAFNLSFILSFTCCLSIIMFYKRLNKLVPKFPRFIREPLLMTLAAQILVIPVLIIYFNSLSIVSVISNIFALPLLPFIIGFGIIFLILPEIFILKQTLIFILSFLVDAFYLIVSYFGKLNFAVINIPGIFGIKLLIVIPLIFILKKLKVTNKFIILSTVIVLVFNFHLFLKIDYFKDSAIIRLPSNKKIMFCHGDKIDPDLETFFIKENISKIDYMFSNNTKNYEIINNIVSIEEVFFPFNTEKGNFVENRENIFEIDNLSLTVIKYRDDFIYYIKYKEFIFGVYYTDIEEYDRLSLILRYGEIFGSKESFFTDGRRKFLYNWGVN